MFMFIPITTTAMDERSREHSRELDEHSIHMNQVAPKTIKFKRKKVKKVERSPAGKFGFNKFAYHRDGALQDFTKNKN